MDIYVFSNFSDVIESTKSVEEIVRGMELSDNQKEEILRKFEKNEKKSWKKGRKNLKTTNSKKEQHDLLKKSSFSLDTNKV